MTTKEMLDEFHTAIGDEDMTGFETQMLRKNLITEEYCELILALNEDDLPHIAKELADLVYVVYGTARAYGIDLDKVLASVHESNMSKFASGWVERRSDGKITKGAAYQSPDLSFVGSYGGSE